MMNPACSGPCREWSSCRDDQQMKWSFNSLGKVVPYKIEQELHCEGRKIPEGETITKESFAELSSSFFGEIFSLFLQRKRP